MGFVRAFIIFYSLFFVAFVLFVVKLYAGLKYEFASDPQLNCISLARDHKKYSLL
jgi:hypothetical protein